MATFGTIGEFREDEGSWSEYIERMGHYFDANSIIDEGRKRSILLSVCGASTYKLMSSLAAPRKPGEVEFKELVKLMTDHRDPKPSVIVQRFKFNSRSRRPDESLSTYIAELRRLANECKFDTILEEMLRDRIVCGVADDRIQRRLLAEPTLTFEKAKDIALAMELADKNTADLRDQNKGEMVNKIAHGVRHRKSSQRPVSKKHSSCGRCGKGQHQGEACPAKDGECFHCGKKGHFAVVCRAKGERKDQRKVFQQQGKRTASNKSRTLQIETREEEEDENESYGLYSHSTKASKPPPIMTQLIVKGKPINFQVDTGSAVTLINEETWLSQWSDRERPKLSEPITRLRTYTEHLVDIIGECEVAVSKGSTEERLPLIVARGRGPNLMGRDWLHEIKLDWREINLVRVNDAVDRLCSDYAELFTRELGKLKGVEVDLDIDPDASPKFLKARPVPFSLRSRLDQELDRLLADDIIEPVQYSNWAAPVVPVVKGDGSIRICGDYKTTINTAARSDTYPIPRVEELFARLANGKKFTKLDLSHAYQQLVLSEKSREFVTINTHRGLFRYKRLPFGVSTAPSVFQRTMESLLAGIPGVAVYLDDLLITGESTDAHMKNLRAVLDVLLKAGLRLKKEKCVFLKEEVDYLGHTITEKGLRPTGDKVQAITNAPEPKSVKELRSFLGLLNYYGKFLPDLASNLEPLHRLLRKDARWRWGKEQKQAFGRAKQLLNSTRVLAHYNPEEQLILACDASPYGVGAVLAHRFSDATEKPIGFASRTLNVAERRYSQLDKEGLAIVFGVKRFHQYLYGRKFEIITDHKPLLGLFGEKKAIPQMASPRVQRWAITLAAYEYEIKYKAGEKNSNADALSRLPLESTIPDPPIPGDIILLMDTLDRTPITPSRARSLTDKDPILSRVRNFILQGWPIADELQDKAFGPYLNRKDELSVHEGVILWGARAVLPLKCREAMMEELHDAHPGIVRMKAMARSCVWWPQIDKDLERKVKSCEKCQSHQRQPSKAPPHQWEYPSKPWSRIHVDYAGPVEGKMLLVIVDAYSKWIDVHITNKSTSEATIDKLREVFSAQGLPQTLVSDNGPCFTSEEFAMFMKMNAINHIRGAPYHPATNGLAERAVQTVKRALRKMSGPLQTRLARFLLSYRTTPQATTNQSPAELLMNRKLRTRISSVLPDVNATVEKKQFSQTAHTSRKLREFKIGEEVLVRNYGRGNQWLPGKVVERNGPVSYVVNVNTNNSTLTWKRHVDQLRSRISTSSTSNDDTARYTKMTLSFVITTMMIAMSMKIR
ncbi:uncharacterized protein K02A2.6-like [Lytechinus variegatus]|uniref:uncharacterized protein K02A2.6-like n=1 Tax=Lytechinus variegatus TaxID=7654 RepID=UPI001BB0E07E|nr:uncharacterized protein K02A2.6-like [Lytechinus variegatus]